MTIEDVRKYAEEKKLPPKVISELLPQIETDKNGNIDEIDFSLICAEIDHSANYWNSVKKIIEHNREERKRKRGD